MKCHEVHYEILGDDMQVLEVELDPGQTVIAEAGAMNSMDDWFAAILPSKMTASAPLRADAAARSSRLGRSPAPHEPESQQAREEESER